MHIIKISIVYHNKITKNDDKIIKNHILKFLQILKIAVKNATKIMKNFFMINNVIFISVPKIQSLSPNLKVKN